MWIYLTRGISKFVQPFASTMQQATPFLVMQGNHKKMIYMMYVHTHTHTQHTHMLSKQRPRLHTVPFQCAIHQPLQPSVQSQQQVVFQLQLAPPITTTRHRLTTGANRRSNAIGWLLPITQTQRVLYFIRLSRWGCDRHATPHQNHDIIRENTKLPLHSEARQHDGHLPLQTATSQGLCNLRVQTEAWANQLAEPRRVGGDGKWTRCHVPSPVLA